MVNNIENMMLMFCRDLYESSFIKSVKTVVNNINNCDATLALCKKLEIVNHVVSLCYGSKSWIKDIALYNFGAMSL